MNTENQDTQENTNPALQGDVANSLDSLIGDKPITTENAPANQPTETFEPWPTSPLGAHIANNAMALFGAKVAPNWELSDDEKNMIALPLAQIITAWLPTSTDQQMNPYIAFLGGCALVAGGKVMLGVPMKKEEKGEGEQ